MANVTKGGVSADTQSRKPLQLIVVLALLCAAAVIGAWWHKHSVNRTVESALSGETGAETAVYRRGVLGGDDIVFDVRSVEGEMSMVAMTRRLLKTAEALKGDEFHRVYLASKGTEKFYFEGAYFKRLGDEREWQNPVYTIRTMPSNVHNLDGTPAFGSWSGGLIGVIGAEMDDNAEFHEKWWVNDAISALPK